MQATDKEAPKPPPSRGRNEKEVKRLCGDKIELTSKCLDITVGDWLCTKKECKPYFVHIPPLPTDKTKDDAFVKDMAKLICGIVDKNPPPARFAAPWVMASEGDGAGPASR